MVGIFCIIALMIALFIGSFIVYFIYKGTMSKETKFLLELQFCVIITVIVMLIMVLLGK